MNNNFLNDFKNLLTGRILELKALVENTEAPSEARAYRELLNTNKVLYSFLTLGE